MNGLPIAIELLDGLVLGLAVPWAAVRMSMASFGQSPAARARNFRGRPVVYGLGVVWLVWAGSAIVGGVLSSSAGMSVLVVLTLAGPLALVAFALGLMDDAYGTSEIKGFGGHLKAMASGRLTTGGLKLIGMGSASLVVALVIGGVAPWGGESRDAAFFAKALLAGGTIALTTNFVNLTDLRPGRALKVYSGLGLCGVVSAFVGLRSTVGVVDPIAAAAGCAALALFVLGPVIAVWPYDLGEVGMLGDAGANPMGAVAGMLLVIGLPWWGLTGLFAAMLALNLASERVSFSKLIDASAPLRWLDGVGRLPESAGHDEAGEAGTRKESNPE